MKTARRVGPCGRACDNGRSADAARAPAQTTGPTTPQRRSDARTRRSVVSRGWLVANVKMRRPPTTKTSRSHPDARPHHYSRSRSRSRFRPRLCRRPLPRCRAFPTQLLLSNCSLLASAPTASTLASPLPATTTTTLPLRRPAPLPHRRRRHRHHLPRSAVSAVETAAPA
eukprot:6213493-Pleurochrysis_carterae.AAC.2